jgi:hypothetical protein
MHVCRIAYAFGPGEVQTLTNNPDLLINTPRTAIFTCPQLQPRAVELINSYPHPRPDAPHLTPRCPAGSLLSTNAPQRLNRRVLSSAQSPLVHPILVSLIISGEAPLSNCMPTSNRTEPNRMCGHWVRSAGRSEALVSVHCAVSSTAVDRQRICEQMLPAAYLRVMFPYSPAQEWSHVGARRLSAAPPAICLALSTIRSSQRDRPWCPPIGAHVGSLGRGVVHVGSGGPVTASAR